MFCFLQLPYHHRSQVCINTNLVIHKRLHQFYAEKEVRLKFSEMEILLLSNRENENRNQKCRWQLFRRSHSEPGCYSQSAFHLETSRTEPEWNPNIDSVSLQSSFIDYQKRRKLRRLKKQQKEEILNTTSSDSESHPIRIDDQIFPMEKLKVTSSIDLSTSDKSSSSFTSSMAKEINYEEDIRKFVENSSSMLKTNIFADPFESEDRRSRIEKWVEETKTTSKSEEADDENAKSTAIIDEAESVADESPLLSSTVTISSLKKSSFTMNLQAAIEVQSEVDVKEIDRFWDYLYEKDVNGSVSEEKPRIIDNPNEISEASRSEIEAFNASPIDVAFSESTKGYSEQDRDLDEIDVRMTSSLASKYFGLEKCDEKKESQQLVEIKNEIRHKNASSQTHLETSQTVQKLNDKKIMHIFFEQIIEKWYENLRQLVIERDRARIALGILPRSCGKHLSEDAIYFQTKYRIKIEQNKEKLDRKIDEIWQKLQLSKVKNGEIQRFIEVPRSDLLTLNATRNLPGICRS